MLTICKGAYVRASTVDEFSLVFGPSADGTWGPTVILIEESGSNGITDRNATHVPSSARPARYPMRSSPSISAALARRILARLALG